MNRVLVIGLTMFLSACSSPPERSYQVTTIQSISYSLMELADRKRQLEQFDSALNLYVEAEKYATQRNDKYLLGLAKLKRASIYLKLQQLSTAQQLITEARLIEQYENVELTKSIDYVRAKYTFLSGDKQQAQQLIRQLKSQFKADSEQALYYQIVLWVYGDIEVSDEQAMVTFNAISQLKDQKQLNNIEIFSYAVYHLAQGLLAKNNPNAEGYILNAIQHFSSIELPNKVSQSYQMAAEFYQQVGNTNKAKYFKQQVNNLAVNI